jgi:hypothetical protein
MLNTVVGNAAKWQADERSVATVDAMKYSC